MESWTGGSGKLAEMDRTQREGGPGTEGLEKKKNNDRTAIEMWGINAKGGTHHEVHRLLHGARAE